MHCKPSKHNKPTVLLRCGIINAVVHCTAVVLTIKGRPVFPSGPCGRLEIDENLFLVVIF